MKGLPSVPFPRHYCTVQQSIQQSIQPINSAINTTIKQQSIRKSWCPCFHSNLNLSLSLSSYLFQLPRRRHFPECFPPQRTLGNLRIKTEQDGRRRMGGENKSGEEEEEKEDGEEEGEEEEGEEDGVRLVLGRTHQRDTSTHKGLTHTG